MKIKISKNKAISLVILVLFIGSLVIGFSPLIYSRWFASKSLSSISLENLDTGETLPFRKFSSSRMVVVVFNNMESQDFKVVLKKVHDINGFLEMKGIKPIFILVKGDKQSLINYLVEEEPYMFNMYTWLYDKEGFIANKLNANLDKARIYYINGEKWTYKYIGDSSISTSTLMIRLNAFLA